jgi:hypothetical protein
MSKLPPFFSKTQDLQKAEDETINPTLGLETPKKIIKLKEGHNKGRQAKVVAENSQEFKIVPRTNQKPFKVAGGPADTAGQILDEANSPIVWEKNRKHDILAPGGIHKKEHEEKVKNIYQPKKAEPNFVFTKDNHHQGIPHDEDQKNLIHGIDLREIKKLGDAGGDSDDLGWTAEWAACGVGKNKAGKSCLVKGRMPDEFLDKNSGIGREMASDYKLFSTAQREAVYYNIAKALGLHKYIPVTSVVHDQTKAPVKNFKRAPQDHGQAGNHYSVMEMIPNAKHYSGLPSQLGTMKRAHDSGDLHKLGLMNAFLYNTDRHGKNFMFSENNNNFHLIDHGLTFGYRGRPFVMPAYLRIAHLEHRLPDEIHPEARNWINNLNIDDIKKELDSHDIPIQHKRATLAAIRKAKESIGGDPENKRAFSSHLREISNAGLRSFLRGDD